MQSHILLVNFTQQEAERLKLPPNVEVHRGFLSDILPHGDYGSDINKTLAEMFRVYFPLAIHEYKAIFVKHSGTVGLDKEFAEKVEPYHEKYISDFEKYIRNGNGFLVVLLGDYKSKNLFHLGVHGINLEKVVSRDKTIRNIKNSMFDKDDLDKVSETLKDEVIMPTHRYITIDEENNFYEKYSGRFLLKDMFKNQVGDVLGCYHSNSMHRSDCEPSLFLLPLFKNTNTLINTLLKELANIYSKFLPEFLEPDWQHSDKYMPIEVRQHGDKISKIINKAESLIKEAEIKQNSAKEKYQYLVNILTQKHEVLKNSVTAVLENIFNIPVTDADKNKTTTLAHEDIVVQVDGNSILAEIKGDSSSYPSTGHIAQLWKHLKHNKEIEKGALILNYDTNTEPEKRKLAYIGEEGNQLEDIIFIDTRVLHNLAVAVIDHGMKPEEVVKILFKSGRVIFDLEEYIKGKK